jgi:hypothetical protein
MVGEVGQIATRRYGDTPDQDGVTDQAVASLVTSRLFHDVGDEVKHFLFPLRAGVPFSFAAVPSRMIFLVGLCANLSVPANGAVVPCSPGNVLSCQGFVGTSPAGSGVLVRVTNVLRIFT